MITTSITSSWRRTLLALAAIALLGTSCQRELALPDVTAPDGQIVFGSEGLDLSVETKATEVTSLSSFYVSAVTGSAGSEASVWNSAKFSQVPGSSPANYTGGKYWPASNPGYKFYGSNVALNFAAEGTYVNASNATDVVCAYLSSPTYNTKNTLRFEHIFARLCRVDVAAQTGYTISNIQMYITPKTGGTYNLRTGAGHTDGTGWSSVATGSATLISNKTGATNNDIYMVPGVYQITCSWVSTDPSGASVTYTDKVTSLPIKGGATNNISVVLGGDIMLGVDLQDYCEYDYRDNLDYLTFYCDEAGTIGWKCSNASESRTIQYSKDFGATWTNLTSTTSGATVSVAAGDIVWFKGSNTEYATSSNYNQFTLSNKAYVYGNVNSLTGNNTSVSEYCFSKLFSFCSNLYTYEHKKIILPATTLTERCYAYMFQGCSSLTSAPVLPATTLASYCYFAMFYGCTSLTSAPELPATTLALNCYASMFQSCTSLTAAPELPATTLAQRCYTSMFQGCTSLTTAPELPATTLTNNCYIAMFQNCTSLTTAPELPATTLANRCYDSMFSGCSSLNYIKALFTTDPSSGSYTTNWVSGVAPTGTFVKSVAATWNVTGDNGVPTGWTVKVETPGPGQWMDNPSNYLRFKFVTDGQVKWQNKKGDIQYSKNGGAWTAFNGATVSMSAGDEIWFKGDLTGGVGASSESSSSKFITVGKFYVSGNVQSLCSFNNTLQAFHFANLFYNNPGLNIDISTPLSLPATSLANYCYSYMFSDCTSLTSAPELPASTLAESCYAGMFYYCTSLTSAPALPATTLANQCYGSMFYNCTSLTSAPALSATTLANSCYDYMFSGCSSLTIAPELPATTLANQCYAGMFYYCTSLTSAPALSATTLTPGCYQYMFQGCTSLTSAPELPATTLANNCYQNMFIGCTSLTTAPELPASTLAESCYAGMFYRCSSLNYIKALFTTTPGSSYTNNWVSGVASTGTFVKADAATWDVTGNNGVPTGWTVVTLAESFAIPGEFSVSSTKKVKFAKGNLQAVIGSGISDYRATASSWKFAEHQYDFIGENTSFTVGTTVDLFGWVGASASYDSYGLCTKTSSNNAYYGTSTSDVLKTDWGSIPGVVSACGDGWYTLSADEWYFVLNNRESGATVIGTPNARYTHATINTDGTGVNGVILFPDGVTIASGEATTWGAINNASDWATKCTAAQWSALESKGCVFLPAAGARNGTSVNGVGSYGNYWTSTPLPNGANNALSVYLTWGDMSLLGPYRCSGYSVRLAREID